MKGPTPKEPGLRRRTNKAVTAATLEAPVDVDVPVLPERIFPGGIHENTAEWWMVIWRSPMAGRWLESDVEGLYLVAVLRNEFFSRPTATLAAEIRQQETRFGLSPIDRRRLDWRVADPITKPTEEQAPEPLVEEADPRLKLRAVK